MISFYESVNRVQRKLDDEDALIWTRDQVEEFVIDGYDHICREAECIFDMVMFDDQPLTGNYTRDHERDFMTTPILAKFNYTKDDDQEFVEPGASGPVNHTIQFEASHFASNDPPSTRRVGILPNNFVSVDRVTHDWLRIIPETARYLRRSRNIYDIEQGGVFSYSQDQDGYFVLRTVGVPVRQVSTVDITGVYGFVRAATANEYWTDADGTPVCTQDGCGVIRQVPQHFPTNQYGMVRRIINDERATRVELFRLGHDPRSMGHFEVPDRVVKYIEWWAMYRAFSTPGEGENRELAAHFKSRFEMGKQRLSKRVNEVMRERVFAMGTKRLGKLDSYLERFPTDYGYKTPFRR